MSTELAHCAYWTAVPWPPAAASRDDAVDQLGGLGLLAAEPASAIAAYGADAGPGRLLDGVDLRDQQGGAREVAAERGGLTAARCRRRRGPRAPRSRGRAGPRACRSRDSVVVPHQVRRPRRQPTPAEHLLRGDLGARERGDRAPQHRRRGGAPLGEDQRRPSSSRSHGERRIRRERARSPRRGRRRAGCRRRRPGRPANSAAAHASRYVSRERRTSSGSSFLAAWSSSSGASPPRFCGERDLGPQQIDAGSPELVERPGLRGRQQPAGRIERARPEAGLGGRERSVGSPRGIARQRDRTLQERGRGGEAAARLRPARRELELARDLLVGPGGRSGQMPRATIRIDVAIRHLRQRQVGRPALRRRRRTGRRPSAPADGGRSRARSSASSPSVASTARRRDPEAFARALQEQRIADRLGRRDEQQTPRVVGEGLEPPDVALLDPLARDRAPPASRTRRPAASASALGAARAARAGCRASPRGSGRAPARPARTAPPSSAARGRRR